MVIPRALRELAGLSDGEVEISYEGAGIRIEPVAGEGLAEEAGRLVIPASGTAVGDDTVRVLRLGDQR